VLVKPIFLSPAFATKSRTFGMGYRDEGAGVALISLVIVERLADLR